MGRRIKEEAILITGIQRRLGKLLVRRLHRNEKIIGIDTELFEDAPKDVTTYQVDLRRRQAEDIFRRHRIKAVIHLGLLQSRRQRSSVRHSINVVGTQMLLSYCERYNIPKAIIVSSANVYGPRPGNPQFLKEDTPLLGSESYYALRDLVSVDMVGQSFFWKHPEVETVILRPVHIVGRLENSPSNYLRQQVVPTIMGFDPMVQLIHEEDVVQGIHRALLPGIRGVFNLAGPGTVPAFPPMYPAESTSTAGRSLSRMKPVQLSSSS
ncbi:MAG: NAD-dependent epimerase/dehydratase family protein [Proteobacteria bacterium]|nr:NAD-dependent epimerase/dehydratase family protein [Pseudomonadota bacterium]